VKNILRCSLISQRAGEFAQGSWFHAANGFIDIGFARRIYADFAHLARKIPVLLHAIRIDHVRAPESIVEALSRPE